MNPEALRILERYDRITERLEQSTIKRLNASLNVSYRALEAEFLRVYPQYQGQSLLARQRAMLVMDSLRPLVDRIGSEPTNEAALREGITEAWAVGNDMAGATYKAISREELQTLSDVPLEAVAAQARDGAVRLAKHGSEFAGRISGVIEQGLVQGWGSRKVAEVLRSEHGLTRVKAETIARTETLSALNSAAEQRYKDAGIEYVQFVSASGKDTCPFCVARNMQVYKVGEVRPPLHPRCLCVTIPYSKKWAEMGLIDEKLSEDYRTKRIADLTKEGKRPNYAVAPFEKAAGLTTAPKAVFVPGHVERAEAPRAKKIPEQPPDRFTVLREQYIKEYRGKTYPNLGLDDEGNTYDDLLKSKGKALADEALEKMIIRSAESKARRVLKKEILEEQRSRATQLQNEIAELREKRSSKKRATEIKTRQSELVSLRLEDYKRKAFNELYGSGDFEDFKSDPRYKTLLEDYNKVLLKQRRDALTAARQSELAKSSFNQSNPALKAKFESLPTPEIIRPKEGKGAYQQRRTIHMDAIKDKDFASIYRHEWGHYYDYLLHQKVDPGSPKYWSSSNPRAIAAFANDVNRINEDLWQQAQAIGINEYTSSRASLADYTIIADMAQALSDSRFGHGHTKEYYSRPGNKETELVANIISLLGSGNPRLAEAAKTLSPSMTELLEDVLDDLV